MAKIIKNRFIKLIPALLWMIIIFYLSSVQTSVITGTSIERFLILKSFHLVEYAILFLLLHWGGNSPKLSLLISYIYAVTDEFHQSFIPGRSGLLRDTFIDLFGIMLAYIITLLTSKKRSSSIK